MRTPDDLNEGSLAQAWADLKAHADAGLQLEGGCLAWCWPWGRSFRGNRLAS